MVADQVGETPCVFLAGLHRAERTVAERLMRLANGPLPWSWIDPDKALPWVSASMEVPASECITLKGKPLIPLDLTGPFPEMCAWG